MGESKSVGLLQGIIGRSGGLGYHLAALYYSKNIWAPFRTALSKELFHRTANINRAKYQLVVIGVSGGYCLDPTWVASFGHTTLVDIDPVAGWLSKRKFKTEFVRQDFFQALESEDWDLEKWFSHRRKSSLKPFFLFSNLLGQLPFIYQGEDFKRVSAGLAQSFARANTPAWISFHDRLTIPGRILGTASESRSVSTEELARAFAPPQGASPIVVEEHEIGEWATKAADGFSYHPWQLTSAEAQIIEICGRI